jgi:NADH dehydrogenase FAD-containing subunit
VPPSLQVAEQQGRYLARVLDDKQRNLQPGTTVVPPFK